MDTRYNKILRGAALWGSFFRSNPDIFAEQYLHLRLKMFQRILLIMMFKSTVFVFIACRGLGKTFLSAIYCCIRCILFPGTRICIASGTRGQALNVLEKITQELMPISRELRAEIKEDKINNTNAYITFHNTSVIKVVTASDSARGNRCNVLLLDEYRLIDKDTIDTVLKKFLTQRRMPKYAKLTEEERNREYSKEKNLTLYLSSAFFKSHWSFIKCLDTLRAMLDDRRKQFVCGFPYQLSIQEGLLDPEAVADEMSESDFSEIKWSMEMCAEWYGSAEDAFFDFDTVSKNRRIPLPMLTDNFIGKTALTPLSIPPKQNGEKRILSADIALMSSKKNKNDATAIFINQMVPTKSGRYISNIVYASSDEGLRTDNQALNIRRMFEQYDCDYLVLESNGIGLGVADALMHDIYDPDLGEVYPAISCCNDKTMAERCTAYGAKKVIWSIKANSQFNSDCAFLLREGFKSGKIRLLQSEFDAEKTLSDIKGYKSLSMSDKTKILLPYINTTLLIDELIKLKHEENNGRIKIMEESGMRKDRYSSLSYNYFVATQLEVKLQKNRSSIDNESNKFIIKAPIYKGRR